MTQDGYYVCHETHREGPLDMVALMRKIRAGKINANTLISTAYSDEAHPLYAYPALEHLLATVPQDAGEGQKKIRAETLFLRGLGSGARLINSHLPLCVITGFVVILLLVLATLAGSFSSFTGGYLVWLFLSLTLYPLLQLMSLRLFRGHYLGMHVLKKYIEESLPQMLLTGIILALSVMAGTALLLLPGIVLFALASYAVPLAAEGNRSASDCLIKSARMALKGGPEHFGALFGFAVINLLSVLFIIPVAIMWPLIAGAIADLYEEAAR